MASHPRTHRALNRPDAGPLPIGIPLETAEPKTMSLPCISDGCGSQVLVTPSDYRKAIRFGLPWAECEICAAEVALLDGWAKPAPLVEDDAG